MRASVYFLFFFRCAHDWMRTPPPAEASRKIACSPDLCCLVQKRAKRKVGWKQEPPISQRATPLKEDVMIKVRPKASHRKARSTEKAKPRIKPVQDRSKRSNEAIFEAAISLLETVNIEDLSHSDIATVASVSKASVYYHFPTIASLKLALSRRFDEELFEHLKSHDHLGEKYDNWPDMNRAGARLARDWLNDNRPACEALYGPALSRENRIASVAYNASVGREIQARLSERFILPDLPNLPEITEMNGEIIDLFWSRSYLMTGQISDHALEESLRASIGYLRNFLADFLPPRATPADREPVADMHRRNATTHETA